MERPPKECLRAAGFRRNEVGNTWTREDQARYLLACYYLGIDWREIDLDSQYQGPVITLDVLIDSLDCELVYDNTDSNE